MSGTPDIRCQESIVSKEINLLQIYNIANNAGLFKKFPFYQPLTVPAKIYEGVDKKTKTFFDSALWITSSNVNDKVINLALKTIFSEKGLDYMVKIKSTAKQMSVKGGITGIVTPLHPGAKKFWIKKGLTIPKILNR